MTLSRITNYVDGNVLTGPQLNNEFDNILNNGPALINLDLPRTTQVQGLIGSMVTNVGSFAALGYSLRSTSGACSVSATSSFSVNTQLAGPIVNGRDQAAALASTTAHFYAISTGVGAVASTRSAGIVSSNPPPLGPTLPAGYSAWCYLASAIYTVATSAMTRQTSIVGNSVQMTPSQALLTGGAATSQTAIGAGAHVPTIAPMIRTRAMRLMTASTFAGGSQTLAFYYVSAQSSTPVVTDWVATVNASPVSTDTLVFPGSVIEVPNLHTTPTVYYSVLQNPGQGSDAAIDLNVDGYTVPNGA